MNDFYTSRRERFLNEETYTVFVKGRNNSIKECQELIEKELPSIPLSDPAYIDWSGSISSDKVELLLGTYSAGASIAEIAKAFPGVLLALEGSSLPHPTYRTEPFYLDEPDTYAYAMWLLSLAKLLRQDHLVPRVAALFDVAREDNRGQDALFETLLDKLGLPREAAAKCLKSMKAHPLLLEVTQAEPAKRPKLMAQFLDKWYPSMKACYWHGRHAKVPQNFFGYWAFEAGLVTYLWDIDDSSYRDMPFYPKDLVVYARTHDAVDPHTSTSQSAQRPQGILGGDKCPRAGFWFTPAQAGSRRYFKAGEVMPKVEGDYGLTIWQWDEASQEPPKL
jgi:hypothetical protein